MSLNANQKIKLKEKMLQLFIRDCSIAFNALEGIKYIFDSPDYKSTHVFCEDVQSDFSKYVSLIFLDLSRASKVDPSVVEKTTKKYENASVIIFSKDFIHECAAFKDFKMLTFLWGSVSNFYNYFII